MMPKPLKALVLQWGSSTSEDDKIPGDESGKKIVFFVAR